MSLVQLEKVRLEYFRYGHGSEHVLLVHGYQASARIWQRVQELLPADRYTSIAINNRGAGASDAPPDDEDYGVQVFAADAHALTQQLGFDKFTLVGHSLGGATAAEFALNWPQQLKGLVLLDPADPDGRAIPDDEVERIVAASMQARVAQAAGADRERASSPADVAGSADAAWRAAVNADMSAAPLQRLRGSLRSMLKLRLGARLATLPMPALLVGGDADELIPVANMLATWARLPKGSGLHFWHGVGHSPNLDCPAALTAVLRSFIEQTIPQRSC